MPIPSLAAQRLHELFKRYETKNMPLEVYREADNLRLEFSTLNIALEDYVDFIVKNCPSGIPLKIDPADAPASVIGENAMPRFQR